MAGKGSKGGAGAAPATKLVQLRVTGIYLDREWRAGEVYDLEASLADRLMGMMVQRGMEMFPVAVPTTDEEFQARERAKAEALAAAKAAEDALKMQPIVPGRDVLESMRLEALRELGAAKGIAGALQLDQASLIAALAPLAVATSAAGSQDENAPGGSAEGGSQNAPQQ